jgi:hypothetical protein
MTHPAISPLTLLKRLYSPLYPTEKEILWLIRVKVIVFLIVVWYELKEYEVEGVKRKLFCRLATNKDVKKQ